MLSKHELVVSYMDVLESTNTGIVEDIYQLLGELGEDPNDFKPLSIMLSSDTAIEDPYLNNAILGIIYPNVGIEFDPIEKSLLENVVSKYVTGRFMHGDSIEYPVGTLTRMIISEFSTQNWIDDKFRLYNLRTYRNIIENWVAYKLNPVLDYYFRLYSLSFNLKEKLILFHRVNYKIGKHLILSFIKKQG